MKRLLFLLLLLSGIVHSQITVVPTILVLIDGEEEERYEADISFSMQATKKEVQEVIDEIVMDQF